VLLFGCQLLQPDRRTQARRPGTDDHDIVFHYLAFHVSFFPTAFYPDNRSMPSDRHLRKPALAAYLLFKANERT
jgi:hypothetical protein